MNAVTKHWLENLKNNSLFFSVITLPKSWLIELFFLFQIIPIESFETQSANGRFVPIVPSGENIQLTFSNRVEYVERALQYRMHEMDRQIDAVREGMGWIIPVPILSLLTGEKLEQLVCGSPEVNVDILKKVVRYAMLLLHVRR